MRDAHMVRFTPMKETCEDAHRILMQNEQNFKNAVEEKETASGNLGKIYELSTDEILDQEGEEEEKSRAQTAVLNEFQKSKILYKNMGCEESGAPVMTSTFADQMVERLRTTFIRTQASKIP